MKMKRYDYLADNIEILGKRLDGARRALDNSKSVWAINYWQNVIDTLEVQWRLLPALYDCKFIMFTDRPRWTVKYDFIEGHLDERGGWISNLYQRDVNFNWSWDNARAQRLARSQ
jgi:hypothetical protein